MLLNKYQWAAIAAALITPFCIHVIIKKRNPYALTPLELANMKAFLLMIQYSEGTYGPNAYHTLYGGSLFNDFSQHPNTPVTKWGITSTAAGAYMILNRVWVELQTALKLPDFSPASQDKAAIELIRKKNALPDVLAGNLEQAIYKCRKIWASLPGAGYGQHENKLALLAGMFQKAGGNLSTA